MFKVILLAILFNTQTGEIGNVQIKGFENIGECETARKEFLKLAKEAELADQVYLRCVSPTEVTT